MQVYGIGHCYVLPHYVNSCKLCGIGGLLLIIVLWDGQLFGWCNNR